MIIKYIIEFAVYIGIAMALLGISVSIYSLVKSKMTKKDINNYLKITTAPGLLIALISLIVNLLLDLNIDFSNYTYYISSGYVLGLMTVVSVIDDDKKQKER